MDSNSSNEKYIPGTCNMGREEIKRRKAGGWAGLVLTVIAITLLLWFSAPHWMRLAVFIPAVMGATGFIQAYNKFCVYFGFGHMFNLGEVGKTDTIDQKEFRAKDRARAWQLLAYAFAIRINYYCNRLSPALILMGGYNQVSELLGSSCVSIMPSSAFMDKKENH
jgi:hypothetical protein